MWEWLFGFTIRVNVYRFYLMLLCCTRMYSSCKIKATVKIPSLIIVLFVLIAILFVYVCTICSVFIVSCFLKLPSWLLVISFSSLQIQFLYVYAGCVAICGICKLNFAPLYTVLHCVINSLCSFHNECEYSKFSFDSPIYTVFLSTYFNTCHNKSYYLNFF